jgi:hypothetical protein
MGYNARNDEIRDNIERMRGDREAYADALARSGNSTQGFQPRNLHGSGRR